jgi:hypothetical protein
LPIGPKQTSGCARSPRTRLRALSSSPLALPRSARWSQSRPPRFRSPHRVARSPVTYSMLEAISGLAERLTHARRGPFIPYQQRDLTAQRDSIHRPVLGRPRLRRMSRSSLNISVVGPVSVCCIKRSAHPSWFAATLPETARQPSNARFVMVSTGPVEPACCFRPWRGRLRLNAVPREMAAARLPCREHDATNPAHQLVRRVRYLRASASRCVSPLASRDMLNALPVAIGQEFRQYENFLDGMRLVRHSDGLTDFFIQKFNIDIASIANFPRRHQQRIENGGIECRSD